MPERPERLRIGDRVTIYSRGKRGIYVADFWLDGKHCRQSLGTANKKIAIQKGMKIEVDLLSGHFQQPLPEATIQSAYEAYVDFHRTAGKAKKTLAKYTGILTIFIAFLAEHRITRLTKFNAVWFDKFRAFRAPNVRARTLYGTSNEVKQFFKWCRSRKLIAENPIADYKLAKPIMEPKEGPGLEQVDRILKATPKSKRAMIAVLAFTGMRAGELQRLQPRDIDLAGNWIYVVSRAGLETKTRLSRKVPIHPRLRVFLELRFVANEQAMWCSLYAGKADSIRKETTGSITKRLNEEFQEVLSKLKMPTGRDHGFTLHSLRRFFETFTVNAGIPQRVIDTWLGHRSDRSMASVYYRLKDEDSQSFMMKVPFGTGATAATAV